MKVDEIRISFHTLSPLSSFLCCSGLRCLRQGRCRFQRGSSLVEIFVLLLVMIPLGLTIPMIGKLIDARQTTELASRYLAWEKTVYPKSAGVQISHEQKQIRLNERFFNDPGVAIQSEEVVAAGSANPLWGNKFQTLKAADRLQLSSQGAQMQSLEVGLPQSAAAVSSGIKKGGRILEFLSAVDWDISENGMRHEKVQVQMEVGGLLSSISTTCDADGQNGEVMGAEESSYVASRSEKAQGHICFSSGNAILTDGWNSGSSLQAEKRTRAWVPAAALNKVGYALSLFGNVPVAKELKGLKHSFGYIDTEQLPLDRYEN